MTEELSLHDLAFAVVGDLDGVSEDGSAVIATILREDPRFAEQLAKLEAMARDVGVESVLDGFEVHRQFDILMSTDWEHPSDVLDEDPENVFYEQLLHLATTLADRADEPEKLLSVERRLESAYALHRVEEDAFRQLADGLDHFEPEVAERMLQRLAGHLLLRRRDSDGQ